jgi:hypothetical protein
MIHTSTIVLLMSVTAVTVEGAGDGYVSRA